MEKSLDNVEPYYRIRELRLAKSWSRAYLAMRADIDEARLETLERLPRTHRPYLRDGGGATWAELRAIAEAMDVVMARLLHVRGSGADGADANIPNGGRDNADRSGTGCQ